VQIGFCEADVLDAYDEWRRALGLAALDTTFEPVDAGGTAGEPARHAPSLPAHLERVVLRLTGARASGTLGATFDALLDRAARELDAARAEARGVRGEARRQMIDRLSDLDAELLKTARATLDDKTTGALTRQAEEELGAFRERMPAEAFARACGLATDRLVRERFGLPTIAFR
jgi:hypothetical protein